MSAVPSKSNASLILDIFSKFNSKPGQVLKANNFIAVATRRHIPLADIQNGLSHAERVGWIEEADDGSLRLTELGFSSMQQTRQ